MQITWTKRFVRPLSTNTDPSTYELVLTATGNEREIDWLGKKISQLGNGKKEASDDKG